MQEFTLYKLITSYGASLLYVNESGKSLRNDCLCYLHYQGAWEKAQIAFCKDYHQQAKRITKHFSQDNVKS